MSLRQLIEMGLLCLTTNLIKFLDLKTLILKDLHFGVSFLVKNKKTATANSDGLINWLRQPGQLCRNPLKSMLENLCRLSASLHRDCFVSRDRVYVGLPAIALAPCFFARHLDSFIVTRNFSAIYLDLLPFNGFTVTLGYSAIYRDWQKTRHRDADGT